MRSRRERFHGHGAETQGSPAGSVGGRGGDIHIAVRDLSINNGAGVSVKSSGSGAGGSATVDATSLEVVGGSIVDLENRSGNVSAAVRGGISGDASGSGAGGSIVVTQQP